MKGFFGKYDQIRSSLWIWSHLLKNILLGNLIFSAAQGRDFQDEIRISHSKTPVPQSFQYLIPAL